MLPFPVLVSYIINLIRRSLQLEVSRFSGLLNRSDVSKQAFSQARKKLSPEVFKLLNEKLITEFYSDNEFETFKGYRILGIDGSTIRLPETEELYLEFGTTTSRFGDLCVPLAKTSVMYDVLNHLTLDAEFNSYATSEKSMAMNHLQKLDDLDKLLSEKNFNDLILADRGYPSLFIMFYIKHTKKDFLIRGYDSFLTEIDSVVQSGTSDSVITLHAFKKDRHVNKDFKKYLPDLSSDATIDVRVLIFTLSSGEKEIILTSLTNQNLFTYEDIFKLYALRWNVEENYKLYKCIAEIQNFSGESKLAVEQDFYATVFTCNISSLLAQEAQDELDQVESIKERKHTYQINRNILIGTTKDEILRMFLEDLDLEAFCTLLKRRLKRSLISIRPGRSFPRLVYKWRERYPVINKKCL